MIKYKIFILKTQGHFLIDILVLVIHTLIVSVLDIFSFYFDDELTILFQKFSTTTVINATLLFIWVLPH